MSVQAAEVLSEDPLYDGCNRSEWSIRWWRWLLSISKPDNPAFDATGRNSDISQRYNGVYFLCQTLGNAKIQIIRKACIPKHCALFMPIVNWISISGVDGESFEELSSVAKKKIDAVAELHLVLNEEEVPGLTRFRSQSSAFEISLPANNILSISPGQRWCVSDGYWVFLKPVKKKFVLSSYGSCSSGATKIGITYELTIL